MSILQTVTEILREHVTLEVEYAKRQLQKRVNTTLFLDDQMDDLVGSRAQYDTDYPTKSHARTPHVGVQCDPSVSAAIELGRHGCHSN